MKEIKNIKFDNLLKKRKELSEKNNKTKKYISSNDPQLIDILDNFNETDEYKRLETM